MNPQDILLWSDGFWCFREEHSETFLRSPDYRVIEHLSDEWRELHNRPPAYLHPIPPA